MSNVLKWGRSWHCIRLGFNFEMLQGRENFRTIWFEFDKRVIGSTKNSGSGANYVRLAVKKKLLPTLATEVFFQPKGRKQIQNQSWNQIFYFRQIWSQTVSNASDFECEVLKRVKDWAGFFYNASDCEAILLQRVSFRNNFSFLKKTDFEFAVEKSCLDPFYSMKTSNFKSILEMIFFDASYAESFFWQRLRFWTNCFETCQTLCLLALQFVNFSSIS